MALSPAHDPGYHGGCAKQPFLKSGIAKQGRRGCTMEARFDWDESKEQDNIARHGVDFCLAVAVFDDPRLVLAEDAAPSATEKRFFAFGHGGGGVLTVRFTVRGGTIRIIGAGCWRKDRDFHEEANRPSR